MFTGSTYCLSEGEDCYYRTLNRAFYAWQQYAVTKGPCAGGDNTADVCIATTFGPVPMPDDNFEVSRSDSEWIATTQLIMDEGLERDGTDSNGNPVHHSIPPLAELRDAFVGFEREEVSWVMHTKAYQRLKQIWWNWWVPHSQYYYLFLLGRDYLLDPTGIDGIRLWDNYRAVVSTNQKRQNTIYTQSAVLIEADPHLREHLPPGASDLLDKVETIKK